MRSNFCGHLHYYFLKLPEFCTLLELSMFSTVRRPYKRGCVFTGFAYGGHYALADIGSRQYILHLSQTLFIQAYILGKVYSVNYVC